MRQQSTASLVVWYDAVTVRGELTWQNTLNDLNRPFFGAADAILVNYAWKVDPLQQLDIPSICMDHCMYCCTEHHH